jgi:hypothetical protein
MQGRAVMKAYLGIIAKLQDASMELSPTDNKLLVDRLNKNPQDVILTESSSVARDIQLPYIEALIATKKVAKRFFWLCIIIGSGALVSFIHLWPATKHQRSPSPIEER